VCVRVSLCQSVSVRVPVTGRHQHAGRYPVRRGGTQQRAPTRRHAGRRCASILARVRPCLCNWAGIRTRGIRSGVGARCRVPAGDSGDTMDTTVPAVWEWCPRNQGGAMACLARSTDVNRVSACQQGRSSAGYPVRRRGTLPRARGGFRGHHGHHCSCRLGMVSPESGWRDGMPRP
jgi:hypothetical protein